LAQMVDVSSIFLLFFLFLCMLIYYMENGATGKTWLS